VKTSIKHNFDMAAGTQEMFRLLLDALANPGRPVNISASADEFAANGRWLAPALTLLDNETGFYWDGPPEVGEEIRFLSGAAQVPPENADFIFLSSLGEMTGDSETARIFAEKILCKVKAGTHRDPHDSALVFIASEGNTSRTLTLKGPGVPPEGRSVAVSADEEAWIKARDAQGFEYPCGVEIIFIREDNSVLAVTRKAAVTWPM